MKKSAYHFLVTNKNESLFLKNIYDRFTDEKPLIIDEIANESFISKSNISRYFKNNGFDGFKGFKYSLLNESNEIDEFKEIEDFESEVIYKPIINTMNLNPEEKFAKIYEYLQKARIINVVGIGGNHSPAYELETRLKKFGFNVFHQFEYRDTLLSLSNGNSKDLVFLFSYTGETSTILKAANIAKATKQTIIAITKSPESTLGKLADVVLQTDSSDNLLRIMPLKSRISMIYLVFKLANYIYQHNQKKYTKIFLQKIYE